HDDGSAGLVVTLRDQQPILRHVVQRLRNARDSARRGWSVWRDVVGGGAADDGVWYPHGARRNVSPGDRDAVAAIPQTDRDRRGARRRRRLWTQPRPEQRVLSHDL